MTKQESLGILVPEFPQQTHIFFWREIVALRKMGVRVRLYSTRRAAPGACRHAFAEPAAGETHYTYPPRLATAAATLAARPLRAARAMTYLASLRESPLTRRAKYLGLFACAADLLADAREHDVTHIHAHSCADAAHMVAMCRLLGGPSYSLTVHGDLPVYGTDHGAKMAGAACIGCDGPHLVKQIVEVGRVAPEKVLPNWMGVDTHRFLPREHRDATPKRLHLVTIARLDACKGHRHAVAAVRIAVDRGYDIRYTLAGSGAEREAIEKQVVELGLTDRVKLLGSRAETEVIELLRDADAFVLPSVGLGEAGPISLMEAMAAGLPAVCSIIGAVPNMMSDGVEGFLVAQGDEAGLASAFIRLADEPELGHRMGEAARARAVAEFEVENTTRRLLELIERNTGKTFRPSEASSAELANARGLPPTAVSWR